ncbi:hypothetical protein FQN52_007873 [Onygenales sp. PD_12]|nr:hypothetical protein FQN52_007873 [Onygenales sp. PD_12]
MPYGTPCYSLNIWVELGGEGSTRGWEEILWYFRKALCSIPPDSEVAEKYNITYDIEAGWGQEEDIHIYASYPGSYMNSQLTYDALKTMPGVPFPADGHGGRHGVVGYPVSVDITTMTRSYSRTGHWDDLKRDNYELITGSRVNKILFDEDVATGVTFVPRDGGNATTARTKKDVILYLLGDGPYSTELATHLRDGLASR